MALTLTMKKESVVAGDCLPRDEATLLRRLDDEVVRALALGRVSLG